VRRAAILAALLALAGCGGSGVPPQATTTKAAACLKNHGWKVIQLSSKELTATRVQAGLTLYLTYQPPAKPVTEIPSAEPVECFSGL
jgi:hypothetical protein